jgi:hypothetical protein
LIDRQVFLKIVYEGPVLQSPVAEEPYYQTQRLDRLGTGVLRKSDARQGLHLARQTDHGRVLSLARLQAVERLQPGTGHITGAGAGQHFLPIPDQGSLWPFIFTGSVHQSGVGQPAVQSPA